MLAICCSFPFPCAGQGIAVDNLALAGLGGTARSWEPGVTSVPEHEPSKVNDDPEGAGWFFKLRLSDSGDFSKLMNAAAYAEFVKGL